MIRGFLAGSFWGGLIGLGIILLSNQVMDRRELSFPKPDAADVDVPAGTEFDQARPETEPVVPEAETRPGADTVAGVAAPVDALEQAPAFDTSSLEVPQPSLDAPGGLGDIPDVADELEIEMTGPGDGSTDTQGQEPALPSPEAPAATPSAETEAPAKVEEPEAADDDQITAPASEDAPEVQETTSPSVAEPIETPDPEPVETEVAAAPALAIEPEASPTPQIDDGPSLAEAPSVEDNDVALARPQSGEGTELAPVDEINDQAPEVETAGLPRVKSEQEELPDQPAATEPEVTPSTSEPAVEPDVEPDSEPAPAQQEEESEQTETAQTVRPTVRRLGNDNQQATVEEPTLEPESDTAEEEMAEDAPALQKYRADYENPEGLPVMSIVLVHVSEGLPDAASLDSLPPGIGFAVDAGRSDAGDVAKAYRDAGREVILIPSLPEGATPQDVEVTMRVNMETITEAIAVMDGISANSVKDRAAVSQIVDVVSATGHGLVTFPRGLNTAYQQAGRAGVPAGLVFRDIDGDDQTDDQIRRAMDRAAFKARQDDGVILVGRAKPGTVSALVDWSLGSRASSVAIAPISATLLGE